MIKKKKSQHISSWTIPLLSGIATAIVIGIGFMFWTYQVNKNHGIAFNNSVNSLHDEISARLLGYEKSVSNIRQLTGPQGITKTDWDAYFKAIDLANYKGLSSVSYSQLVLKNERTAYERQHYRIFPPNSKDEYLPVTYITPASPAFMGFDSGTSSPDRYAWITKARDTGQLQRSNAYTFKSSANAEAIPLMFLTVPIYRSGVSLITAEDRRQNYEGTVLGTMRIDQFVPAILSDILLTNTLSDIEIYDSNESNATNMHDSNLVGSAKNYSYNKTMEISLGNRPLVIALGADQNILGKLPARKWLATIVPFSLLAVFIVRKRQH